MWQFHSGEMVREEDGGIVSLQEVTNIDLNIMEIADLPLGWIAIREDKNDNWKRLKRRET